MQINFAVLSFKPVKSWVPQNGARAGLLALPDQRCNIWSIDFVYYKLSNGRAYKMLIVMEEYSRQALTVHVSHKMRAADVLEALYPLIIKYGKPEFIRSDNGPEFIAQSVRDWVTLVGSKTVYIEPGSPWENGCCESFNARFRDELLNGEIFYTFKEAQVIIKQWLKQYNHIRPHQALNMKPPVPETTTLKMAHNPGA